MISLEKQFTPDPLYGNIEVPTWFLEIEKFPSIRRMMFIRQLGLKAYIDFPCAIHTRYSHSLGVMELSRRLVNLLEEKQKRRNMNNTQENLRSNLNNLMAAGVLHDIGHGPFSHVLDFPIHKICGKNHEELSIAIIRKDMKCLENHGITLNIVEAIIRGIHDHQFIHQIINGPIDADKLDYLLRDSYHVGLKYSFDVNYFVNNYAILGNDKDLKTCILGLDYNIKAITTYELFVVIWKSMYDLVYFSDSTRIAESMLEKSILLAIEQDKNFKKFFDDLNLYISLNDEGLLKELESIKGQVCNIISNIKDKNLYILYAKEILTSENLKFNIDFLNQVTLSNKEQISNLSDKLSIQICENFEVDKYRIICDILKTRTPKDVCVDNYSPEGEPYSIRDYSDIIPAIRPKIYAQFYIDPPLTGEINRKALIDSFYEQVRGWKSE